LFRRSILASSCIGPLLPFPEASRHVGVFLPPLPLSDGEARNHNDSCGRPLRDFTDFPLAILPFFLKEVRHQKHRPFLLLREMSCCVTLSSPVRLKADEVSSPLPSPFLPLLYPRSENKGAFPPPSAGRHTYSTRPHWFFFLLHRHSILFHLPLFLFSSDNTSSPSLFPFV